MRLIRTRGGLCKLVAILICICVVLLYLAPLVEKVVVRILRVPWTAVPWHDEDFANVWFRNLDTNNEIIILRWTTVWQTYSESPLIYRANDNCSDFAMNFTSTCRISYDRRYLSQSDALAFYLWDFEQQEFPQHRNVEQPWVFLNYESPDVDNVDLNKYPHFNWTMTYRRDSDIFDPYGRFIALPPNQRQLSDADFYNELRSKHKAKTKLATWIVSKCKSPGRREDFVAQLRKHMPIDVFGKCGVPCPVVKAKGDCYARISPEYKFYFAFENSLCVDYVTEKFFKAFQLGMVPVVYGGANYSLFAPPGSYINSRDFENAEELAKYLLFLNNSEEEYLKYFKWQQEYKVARFDGGWCKLCQKLHDLRQRGNWSDQGRKWYGDLNEWWYDYEGIDDSNHLVKRKACEIPSY